MPNNFKLLVLMVLMGFVIHLLLNHRDFIISEIKVWHHLESCSNYNKISSCILWSYATCLPSMM